MDQQVSDVMDQQVHRALEAAALHHRHHRNHHHQHHNHHHHDHDHEQVMDLLIKHVEPLLFLYGVDLGFYGHNHVVQRHAAVFNK
jgi:hypothetical protein